MPTVGKYQVTVGFTLTADVEPDGNLRGTEDDPLVSEFEDESSWYADTHVAEGGQVTFVIEANSEEHAREMADNLMRQAYWSGDSLDWEIDGIDVMEVEEIVPPMDMERAMTLFRAVLDRLVVASQISTEEQTAFLFILEALVAAQPATQISIPTEGSTA